jgi:hypothetical protein
VLQEINNLRDPESHTHPTAPSQAKRGEHVTTASSSLSAADLCAPGGVAKYSFTTSFFETAFASHGRMDFAIYEDSGGEDCVPGTEDESDGGVSCGAVRGMVIR